jgi:hypothetical protein
VSLASEVFEGGNYRGVTFIPKGMIRELTDVGRKRRDRNRKPSGEQLETGR